MEKPEPRYSGLAAQNALIEKFGWSHEGWMQDWPLEISAQINIRDCIEEYEGLTDSDEKFLLMTAILYALDDCADQQQFEYYGTQVSKLLLANFDLHKFTIYYWTLYETSPGSDDDVFTITPLMRKIWQEKSNGG